MEAGHSTAPRTVKRKIYGFQKNSRRSILSLLEGGGEKRRRALARKRAERRERERREKGNGREARRKVRRGENKRRERPRLLERAYSRGCPLRRGGNGFLGFSGPAKIDAGLRLRPWTVLSTDGRTSNDERPAVATLVSLRDPLTLISTVHGWDGLAGSIGDSIDADTRR